MSPIDGLDRVGLLGGGVIGGGWAARFLLNGVDVKMYDPDPEAPRKVAEVMADLVLDGRDGVPEGFRVEDSL